MTNPPPPIDSSLLDPHKRSLRPGVSPPAAKHAVPTQPPKPNSKPPVSRPTPPSPQKSIPPAAEAAKPSTTESKSEKLNSKASSEQPSATSETKKRHSAPPAESKTTENEAKQQLPKDSSDQPNGKAGSGMAAWIVATIFLAVLVIACVVSNKNEEIENLKREIVQLTEREAVQHRESNAQTRKGDARAERIERLEKLLADRDETVSRKDLEIARLEHEKSKLQSNAADLIEASKNRLADYRNLSSDFNALKEELVATVNKRDEAQRQLEIVRKLRDRDKEQTRISLDSERTLTREARQLGEELQKRLDEAKKRQSILEKERRRSLDELKRLAASNLILRTCVADLSRNRSENEKEIKRLQDVRSSIADLLDDLAKAERRITDVSQQALSDLHAAETIQNELNKTLSEKIPATKLAVKLEAEKEENERLAEKRRKNEARLEKLREQSDYSTVFGKYGEAAANRWLKMGPVERKEYVRQLEIERQRLFRRYGW